MTRTLLASLLVVALPAAAVAQGLILPQRIMTPDGPSVAGMPLLVVKSIKVTTEISEQVAKTHVDQMFHNPSRWRMEGQYLFLLPKQASVSDFALYIDGKKTPGELLEKEKARGIYEGIVRRMQDPALLEYMGSNVFQARIFPIEPNSDRRIEMTYQEVLHQDFNLIKYVYPLQMPPHLTQPVGEFVITASIKSKSALKNIYSPTHVVATSRKGENEATVSFEGRNVVPDNDFALYYSTSDQEVGINLVCYRPDAGEDGYFMVLLSPKADPQKGEVMAKDIAFVLDTSGSMLGERIVQAKKALKFCVQSLNREDRFNIITFATEATPFADTLMEATNENLKKAVDFIDRDIKAAGGTNPNEALLEALKRQPADRLRPYMICFITDGEPTVGVVDAKEIVENVKKANHTNVRIFSLGIGEELNTKLIDEVATSNFGVSEYIRPKEDIELKVSNFYNSVASPVLSHLAIDFGKVKTSVVYPKHIPDLFKGSQLTVVGRYKTFGATAVKLAGSRNGKTQEFYYDATFPETAADSEFLPRIWATRMVGYLLEEIRLNGEKAELKDEIVRLAKRYAIVTPYTSYLVVEDTPQTAVRPPPMRRTPWMRFQASRSAPAPGGAPASSPHVLSMPMEERNVRQDSDVMRKAEAKAKDFLGATSGSAGVRASESIRDLKEASGISGKGDEGGVSRAGSGIRKVGARTFLFQGGRWVDTAIADQPGTPTRVEIKYGSNAYFSLLAAFPELGRYAALGKKIEVLFRGKVVLVDELTGQDELSEADLERLFGKR